MGPTKKSKTPVAAAAATPAAPAAAATKAAAAQKAAAEKAAKTAVEPAAEAVAKLEQSRAVVPPASAFPGQDGSRDGRPTSETQKPEASA